MFDSCGAGPRIHRHSHHIGGRQQHHGGARCAVEHVQDEIGCFDSPTEQHRGNRLTRSSGATGQSLTEANIPCARPNRRLNIHSITLPPATTTERSTEGLFDLDHRDVAPIGIRFATRWQLFGLRVGSGGSRRHRDLSAEAGQSVGGRAARQILFVLGHQLI